MSHALALSPGGRIFLRPDPTAEPAPAPAALARLTAAFATTDAPGLELMAGQLLDEPLPAAFNFWRGVGRRFFTALCHQPASAPPAADVAGTVPPIPPINVPVPPETDLQAWVDAAPPMLGLEYLDVAALTRVWTRLEERVRAAIAATPGGLAAYLQNCNPVWNLVGRVTFHLAENKRQPEYPFAFLATYAQRVSEQGKVQHAPLGRALEEYAGARNRAALAALLAPVQRAAEQSPFAKDLLATRAVFHPQAWRPAQAFALLQNIPVLEQCGVVVRIPDWWRAGRPPRPQVSVRLGEAKGASKLGANSLLDFQVEMVVDGEPLDEKELAQLLRADHGLVLLKGKWVEVDPGQLKEVLAHWQKVRAESGPNGLPLLEGLRMLAGYHPKAATPAAEEAAATRAAWSTLTAGGALQALLAEMQEPAVTAESDPGPALLATLRPYQRAGAHWLWFMNRLGLGACLADDMGLGKTIQVLSLLLVLQRRRAAAVAAKTVPDAPSLLVLPASLIANWQGEIRRFAPSLTVFYAHPAITPADQLAAAGRAPRTLADRDLVITSYAMVVRLAWLKETAWNVVILDEAQAIKNPGARQSKVVRELHARHRLALTGTPIENRLSDLWSLFDFLSPGLLGGAREFGAFLKRRPTTDPNPYLPLRRLVRPYILRRLKTDRRIISDLPEKTELTAFCPLSRRQAALYQQAVDELGARLAAEDTEGIQRRGIILAFLTRFKQICNHPAQWLGTGGYEPAASGKFVRLGELAEAIAARQEKVLVFTQYRELTEPLAAFLAGVFGRPGLVLHGGTPVARRQELVTAFQSDAGPPFFVLSLKAGGTGLTLTAAAHVIHFDRWWNPAVENQATDRAFRIGQRRNVMVHKFTCRGTLEERIEEVIAGKRALAEDLLGEGGERLLTEMNNQELLQFVALDLTTSAEDPATAAGPAA